MVGEEEKWGDGGERTNEKKKLNLVTPHMQEEGKVEGKKDDAGVAQRVPWNDDNGAPVVELIQDTSQTLQYVYLKLSCQSQYGKYWFFS